MSYQTEFHRSDSIMIFISSTKLLCKTIRIDILAKHFAILMFLVTIALKLKNRFSWVMKDFLIVEKPHSIMVDCRDWQ